MMSARHFRFAQYLGASWPMHFRVSSLTQQASKALIYATVNASLGFVFGFVWHLNNRAGLSVWHLVELDEVFTVGVGIDAFVDYLVLESRLFRQLDERVYAKVSPAQQSKINRFNRGSLSDP